MNYIEKYLFVICLLIGLSGISIANGLSAEGSDQEEVVDVFILAGQSNAVGYNNINTYTPTPFPETLRSQPEVMFWPGSNAAEEFKNQWIHLRVGASYVGKHSFGPEIGFGKATTAGNPQRKIAILKYAVGGTGIARSADYDDFIPQCKDFNDKGKNWYPGADKKSSGVLYQNLIENITKGLNDLKKHGISFRVAGFIWMQGEHEAGLSLKMAKDYELLLTNFIDQVRFYLENDELPVVIGQVSDKWCYKNIVQTAQFNVCAQDPFASLVVTKDLPRTPTDDAHYTANGMVMLGNRFAKAMHGLISSGK
ncbi:hypothetical protein EYV94_00780 [Puteibacter caeruleilacunae]|nr:hypothetical protein EYV94_00780 [Puteibacter caeruleilacunae]